MTILSKAGQFTVATSDTVSKTITGVGFTPEVVIFWSTFLTTVSANTEYNTSFGAMTSSAQWCVYGNRRTTAGSGQETQRSTTSVLNSGAGTLSYNAMNSDGFVLNIDTAMTNETATVNYLALAGTSLDVTVGTVTGPTSTGTFSVASLGFTPNALILAVSAEGTAPSSVSYGMATGTSNEGSIGWNHFGFGPTDQAMSRNDLVISGYGTSGASNTFPVTEFTSFDSGGGGGFTLNRTAANTGTTAHVHCYVALRASGGASVTNSTIQTATGTDLIGTTTAAPSALIAMSLTSIAANTEGGPTKAAIGFVDSAGNMAGSAFHAATDNTTSNYQKEHYTTHVLKQISSAAAVEGSVLWDSWASTGVNLNTDDAFPTGGNLTTLLLVAGAPTISSTSDTNTLVDESSFVITGTNLTSATAVTFKQTGRPNYNATAFVTANDATTVTLTGLDVQDMSFAYGTAAGVGTTVSVTTASGTSSDFGVDVDQKAAHQYITLSGHTTGAGWALGEATANGDQLVAPLTTTKGGTFAFVGTDGSYTITYPGDAPTNDSAYWAWFDDSADQWYESNIAINAAGSGPGVIRPVTKAIVSTIVRSSLRTA